MDLTPFERKSEFEWASSRILIRSPSMRGVAEEAPGAYKDISEVVDAADQCRIGAQGGAGAPLICIKG